MRHPKSFTWEFLLYEHFSFWESLQLLLANDAEAILAGGFQGQEVRLKSIEQGFGIWGILFGLYRDNGKANGTAILLSGEIARV